MKFIYSIYKLNVNGLNYIGSSWDCYTRIDRHKKSINNLYESLPVYKYAKINNIDWNDFNVEIIYSSQELNTKNNLLRRQTEQYYINKYDSIKNGLNDCNAYVSPEEHKKQLSINQKKYNSKNKTKIQATQKIYNNNNKPKIQANQKIYNERSKLKKEIKNIFKIWANYHNIF